MLKEKGSLKKISVIKLLLNVYEENLTGILYLKRDIIIKVLYFNRGKLIWAVSNSEVDKLENLFISRGMVKAEVIKSLDNNRELKKSIGKTMVEKGLITLEELINVTKIQLEKIIFSVLKWNDGAFQFVNDKPPERLLSLDINVTEFVINFILEEIEMTAIWKNIKSLQVVYKKNPDEKKVAKFNLSEKQKELLDSFTRGENLEDILSKQGGAHKDSLLKIVYFYILADLLIKEDKVVTSLPPPPEIVIEDEIKINPLEDTSEIEKLSEYTLEGTGKGEGVEDLIKDVGKPYVADNDAEKADEKGEVTKKLSFVWGFILLILVIAAVIFLILNHLNTAEQEDLKDIRNKQKEVSAAKISTGMDNKQQEIKPQDTIGAKDNLSVEKVDKNNNKDEVIKMQKQTEKDTKENKEKVAEIKKTSPEIEEKTKVDVSQKDALTYFKQKELKIAADIWKNELKSNKIKYSILLEMDCLVESVLIAYGKIIKKGDFFILTTIRNGKMCYLVFWGKFKSENMAIDSIKQIPDFFFQQSPPRVTDIAQYLR